MMIHHPHHGTFPSIETLIAGQVGQFWKAHQGHFSNAPKRFDSCGRVRRVLLHLTPVSKISAGKRWNTLESGIAEFSCNSLWLIAWNVLDGGLALRLSEEQIAGELVSVRQAVTTNDDFVGDIQCSCRQRPEMISERANLLAKGSIAEKLFAPAWKNEARKCAAPLVLLTGECLISEEFQIRAMYDRLVSHRGEEAG
jgi:hypothetical protein